MFLREGERVWLTLHAQVFTDVPPHTYEHTHTHTEPPFPQSFALSHLTLFQKKNDKQKHSRGGRAGRVVVGGVGRSFEF